MADHSHNDSRPNTPPPAQTTLHSDTVGSASTTLDQPITPPRQAPVGGSTSTHSNQPAVSKPGVATQTSTQTPLSQKTRPKSLQVHGVVRVRSAGERQANHKMSVDGKVVFGTYDEMMEQHVPPPPQGDCSDTLLITDEAKRFFSRMKKFTAEFEMYKEGGPLVSIPYVLLYAEDH